MEYEKHESAMIVNHYHMGLDAQYSGDSICCWRGYKMRIVGLITGSLVDEFGGERI